MKPTGKEEPTEKQERAKKVAGKGERTIKMRPVNAR